MHMIRYCAPLASVVVVLLAAAGCSDNPPVYRVKGKVSFEGKSMVGGGSIAFIPLGNQKGKTAAGEIAADGTYELMTHKSGDGSMAGEFRVVITQIVEDEPALTKDGEKPSGKSVSKVAPADRIPTIYGDHYNSPLTAKVEAKDSNEINFDLKRVAEPERPKGAMRGNALDGKFALVGDSPVLPPGK